MITFKCKMCGGDLHPIEGAATCECEYCGSVQTIPTADNEKKMNLFGRAQRLLRSCEFDKAAGVFESIVAEFPEEAEAYWGLVLCKYGIEYVDDPTTGKKVPTCHRTRPDSVLEDSDFEQACENSDPIAKQVYRNEAKAIDQLQQDILAIAKQEEPYDVFICYKETDANGGRTEDSVLSQDIYDNLTSKGLKVFFSRITLEDKLGRQYEPYIYAALHSARVMLAIGTSYEYFDAIWVKNEWARFLAMMRIDKTKTLIPCYKGVDAYDMPKEFKNLQAQDMSKLGWLQDLTRGVLKLCGKDTNAQQMITPASVETAHNVEVLLDRATFHIEKEEWDEACKLADEAINLDPKNGKAYLIRLMAEYKWSELDKFWCQFKENARGFTNNPYYSRALALLDEDNKKKLKELGDAFNKSAKENTQKRSFAEGYTCFISAESIDDYKKAKGKFSNILEVEGAKEIREKCDTIISKMMSDESDGEKKAAKTYDQNQIEEIKGIVEGLLNAQSEFHKICEESKTPFANEMSKCKAQKAETEERILRLRKELEGLRGLFVRKRRTELEGSIDKEVTSLREIESKISKIEQALYTIQSKTKEQESSLVKSMYETATEVYNRGFAEEALVLLQKCYGYKPAEELRREIEQKSMTNQEDNVQSIVGTTIKMGRYQQMMQQQTGPEPIEWLVLDKKEGAVLLLSKYGLEMIEYDKDTHKEYQKRNWKDSGLRAWLNKEFYEKAFFPEEQSIIMTSQIDNYRMGVIYNTHLDEHFDVVVDSRIRDKATGSDEFECWGDEATEDKLFILNWAEIKKYLPSRASMACPYTRYVKQKDEDGWICCDNGACVWWIRSTRLGDGEIRACCDYGDSNYGLADGDSDNQYVVRPAMWIDYNLYCKMEHRE